MDDIYYLSRLVLVKKLQILAFTVNYSKTLAYFSSFFLAAQNQWQIYFCFTMVCCIVIIRGLVMILQSLYACPRPLQLSRSLASSSVQPPVELKFNFAVNYAF